MQTDKWQTERQRQTHRDRQKKAGFAVKKTHTQKKHPQKFDGDPLRWFIYQNKAYIFVFEYIY